MESIWVSERGGDVEGGPQVSDLFFSIHFIHGELPVMWTRRLGHVEFPLRCQDANSTSVGLNLWVFSTEETFGLGVSSERDGERRKGDDRKVE